MIGGQDILIPSSAGVPALYAAARATRLLWPQAVFDDAGTGRRYQRYGDLDFTTCREILVYRDAVAAAQWDAMGADASLHDTMIHFIQGPAGLTVVTDAQPSARVLGLVDAIRGLLRNDIFAVVFPVRKAA